MPLERLDKILASTGRWSRREVKDLVRQGRVQAGGMPAAGRRTSSTPPRTRYQWMGRWWTAPPSSMC